MHYPGLKAVKIWADWIGNCPRSFVSLDLLICKGYQQTTPAGKELNKSDINSMWICSFSPILILLTCLFWITGWVNLWNWNKCNSQYWALLNYHLFIVNPFKPKEHSYLYQKDKSISNFRGVGWYYPFLFKF